MSIQIEKTREDQWTIHVGDVVLGKITRIGKGFWGTKGPFQYEFRSTVTVLGQDPRRFGKKYPSFDDASETALTFFKNMAKNILGE